MALKRRCTQRLGKPKSETNLKASSEDDNMLSFSEKRKQNNKVIDGIKQQNSWNWGWAWQLKVAISDPLWYSWTMYSNFYQLLYIHIKSYPLLNLLYIFSIFMFCHFWWLTNIETRLDSSGAKFSRVKLPWGDPWSYL